MTAPAIAPPPVDEAAVLQFARAFRAAARAVAFYPPAHRAVVSSLEHLVAATRPLSGSRSLCLTILPNTFLVGGVALESTEAAVSELAGILHRHGVGAVGLSPGTTLEEWRALLALLARAPDDVRAAGGIGRQWKGTGHQRPAILEIDFGELLRGRIGGDFVELAGVISHYLETGTADDARIGDIRATIAEILAKVGDEQEAAAAIVKELRVAAYLLRATNAEHADEMFTHAASLAGRFPEGVMAGVLDRRGTPEAVVGTTDVVGSFAERLTDRQVAEFLMSAVSRAGGSKRLAQLFARLVPAADRRSRIVLAVQRLMASGGTTGALPAAHGHRAPGAGTGTPAHEGAFEREFLAKWRQLERELEAHSDPRFVSGDYARELRSAREKSADEMRALEDPPQRVAAWLASIDEAAVEDLDLRLLLDLARAETDVQRWPAVLEILRARIVEAAGAGDWAVAAVVAEAVARQASEEGVPARRRLARQALDELSRMPICAQALAGVAADTSSPGDGMTRVLRAVGPALVPALVARYADEMHEGGRARIEAVIAGYGRASIEPLKQLLRDEAPAMQCAALSLLQQHATAEQLPILESLLSSSHAAVQREALRALATTPCDRAADLLVRAIVHSDPPRQRVLVDELASFDDQQSVPVLRRLLAECDQRTVPRPVYLAIIEALRRAGGEEAASALRSVFERTTWRTPWRAVRFRSAASAALRAMR